MFSLWKSNLYFSPGPALFLLVIRFQYGDAREQNQKYHSDEQNGEKSLLHRIGFQEACEHVTFAAVYLHGFDSAEHVEDFLDEVDELADAPKAMFKLVAKYLTERLKRYIETVKTAEQVAKQRQTVE